MGGRRPRTRHRLLARHDRARAAERRALRPDGPLQHLAAPRRHPDKIPTDRYIDGIDQTSFLLADDGKSNREKVYIWNEANLMAMRMYEYKIHVKVVEEHAQWLNIDMTTVSDVGLAPWLFNLYIDPKEEYPVGHRMNAFLASMAAENEGPCRDLQEVSAEGHRIGTLSGSDLSPGRQALPPHVASQKETP